MTERKKPTFKACDLKRMIEAAKDCGLTVYGAEVSPDGNMTILTQPTSQPLTDDPFARWEKKRGRAA
jgi:hypothetical protein